MMAPIVRLMRVPVVRLGTPPPTRTLNLKLKNFESNEILTVQILSSSSLVQLQETLFQSLPPNPLHVSPSSIHFSMDANSLLSLDRTLNSLGDLLYFSFNPDAFSDDYSPSRYLYLYEEEFQQQPPISDEVHAAQDTDATETMDSHAFAVMVLAGEQLGDNNRSFHNLLAIAVHAILLDSGFVLIDPVSRLQMDRPYFPDEWPSPFSLCYSLPQLLRLDDDSGPDSTDHVVLKFQTLGQFFHVYASLSKQGSGLHRLSLDEHKFAPTLHSLWANDGSINLNLKNHVMKLWKVVKDGVALPLLIDLSYTTGSSLPACFMSLLPELKLKIMDSLHGTDAARMACVCSEMRTLASNNDMWKRKVVEVFGDRLGDWLGEGWKKWKKVFEHYWLSRKKRKRVIEPWQAFPVPEFKRDKRGDVIIIYEDGSNGGTTLMRYLGNAEKDA